MSEASKLNTHHDEKSSGVHFLLNTNYLPRGSQEEAGYTTVMRQNTHTQRMGKAVFCQVLLPYLIYFSMTLPDECMTPQQTTYSVTINTKTMKIMHNCWLQQTFK